MDSSDVKERLRRRDDDERLVARLGSTLAEWWHLRLSLAGKTLAVLGVLVAVLVSTFSAGAGAMAIQNTYKDIPDRVTALEDSLAFRRDSVIRPGQEALVELRIEVRSTVRRLDSAEAALARQADRLDELLRLAASNNCWLRVQAGEESRFNCVGGTP